MASGKIWAALSAIVALGSVVVLSAGCGSSIGGSSTNPTSGSPGGGGSGGGGNSAGTSQAVYQGTQAPGDPWSWTITTAAQNTFSATNSKTGYTYSGTWTKVSSGYTKLKITSTTEPNLTVPAIMYGLEVPGTLFIAKPAGANTNPVLCASLGSPPTATTLDYNYVHIPELGYTPATGVAYGTMDFGVSGDVFSGSLTQFNITGTAVTPDPSFTLVDNNGLLSGGTVTGGITKSGVAILDLGPNSGGAVAVPQATSNISIASIASGNYLGVHVNPTDGCFLLHSAGNGTGLTLGTYSNLDTNAQNSNYGTITFTGQPSPGQLTATISYTASKVTAPAVFVANVVNGKYILFGIVRHPNGTAHFTLVQQ